MAVVDRVCRSFPVGRDSERNAIRTGVVGEGAGPAERCCGVHVRRPPSTFHAEHSPCGGNYGVTRLGHLGM